MSKAEGDAHKAKGNGFFKSKDYPQAIEWYSKAIEAWDQDHTYFSNRSASYAGLGEWENAREDGASCIKIKKDFIKGYFRKATAQEALNELKGASDTIIQGLAVEPRNKDLLAMKTRIDGLARREKSELLQQRASACEAAGDLAGAFKALESARAVEAENTTLQAKFEQVKAQYERSEKARRSGLSNFEKKKEAGDDKYKSGMFEEAISLYSQCIDSAPDRGNPTAIKALSNRSACYKQISNFDGTIEDCTSVLEFEPDNVKALVRRAQAFEAVERYKLALQDVKYVISMGINVAGMQNYKLCNQMNGRLARVVEQQKAGNY
mmetsp:Transcript_23807/g.49261  ORF Transcript_23807/g.49261 Transcript_23807/m.49261 type:complete len:322 (-) Transcript_23807:283-1248(-)|eukprot:CAMPEP_0182533322 /NCGR_PEP_ID=MMETSP1323-20130603/13582_1 /TAXON_ID=236787 /ORGANISM="Florenciella parvula, Strain RCC1693" /LENGTH=321 /DNA_ID=CAMNT_0024743193 /DNA_START=48 /DNA_END=1013 /DNA_ORIENTATION=+